MSSPNHNQHAPQFITVPLTGMQIYRRLMLGSAIAEVDRETVWKAARQLHDKPAFRNALLPIVSAHITCDEGLQNTGWIACAPNEAVFFRITRIGSELAVDLVIDTHSGAGKMVGNRIDCLVESGTMLWKKKHHLASFVIEANRQPKNVIGSLVMDFGNSGTSFIFSPAGTQPLDARPVFLHNSFDPFDANELKRPKKEKCILKSSTLVLLVPEGGHDDPWIVLGNRAEELIANQDPLVTSLYAPKKYVRDWPEHLKALEPTAPFRGLQGQRNGLFPILLFVGQAVKQMLQLVLSSLTNPNFASNHPQMYPQVREMLLTYPLTWRQSDRTLFKAMVQDAAQKLFVLDDKLRENFQVELICSEPVAVAAYVLWEVFFHFFHFGARGVNLTKPSLVSSLLGNTEGTAEARLLIVDIGGGSTDIALIEAVWAVAEETADAVDVRFRVLESLRFNRAGDRISHILATAILEYIRLKYKISESLDFSTPSSKQAFSNFNKRPAVSKITELVEQAKAKLCRVGEPWVLAPEDEGLLLGYFEPAVESAGGENTTESGQQLEISLAVLQQWIEADVQSPQTRGEPGFMDIFFYLGDLHASLRESNRLPHLVVLSGRTTRLPFIKDLTARHLHMPLHRVLTLGEVLPACFQGPDRENMDKLAVVYGAHRFRFGDPIRFIPLPDEPVFKRYIGTLTQTPAGLKVNRVLVEPGTAQPKTCIVRIPPGGNVLLGHAFLKDSNRAEVIATLSNNGADWRDAEIDFVHDYAVTVRRTKNNDGVVLTEWVPGGTSNIVDNFNDTGRIDGEPEGFLKKVVLSNQEEWIKG